MGGSDGDRSRTRTMPAGYVAVASAPPRRTVGTSGRAPYQRARGLRLTSSDRAAIGHAAAVGSSHRELAKHFGVNHEAIREVVWQGRPAAREAGPESR